MLGKQHARAIIRDYYLYIEAFPSCVCFADLQYVDGRGELTGALGAEPAEDALGLALGARALVG
jgi:hypothetical protein